MEWFFAMRSENWKPLMKALSDDVSCSSSATEILGERGDARTGFHFDYKLGRSMGRVSILLLAINPRVFRRMPPPDGVVDVTAHIELPET
jgi:hypothetical protein